MRKFCLSIAVLCWFAGIVSGLGGMARHAATPGILQPAPDDWPLHSRVPHITGRATLLLFAHPRCPCTRATLAEWQRLLTQCGETVTPTVLFIHPSNTDANWAHTDLWQQAQTLPNTVLEDGNGVEARRFHAATSGLVLFYGAEGRLVFRGGITPGRGQEGDSPGREAILAALQKRAPHPTDSSIQNHSFVFGCSLNTPTRDASLPSPLANVKR